MPENKGQRSASWYSLAFAGAVTVVASVSAVGMLYRNYQKNEQKKLTRKIKKEKKRSQREKEREKECDEGTPVRLVKATTPKKSEEKASSITSEEGKGEIGVNKTIKNEDINKDKLLLILNEIYQGITATIQQLASDERFREPGISEEVNAEKVKKFYESAVEKMRSQILEKHNTSDDQISEALNMYMQDQEVTKICVQIERINKAFHFKEEPLTKDELSQIPENFTVDILIELITEMGKKMSEAQRQMMIEARSQSLNHSSTMEASLNKRNQEKMMQIQQGIFAKYGASDSIVTLAMQKYCNDPKLQSAVRRIQQTGQEEMHRMAAAQQASA